MEINYGNISSDRGGWFQELISNMDLIKLYADITDSKT